MDLQQRPELRHKVTLSPQVYQGLSILAMPVAELQQMIEVEMLENPLLEVDETDTEPVDGEEPSEDPAEDERSWDEWLEMYEDLDQIEPTAPRDPNAEQTNTDEFVGGVQSFDDYLLDQISLLDISEDVSKAARAVVGSLDDDGFFRGSLEEVAALVDVTLEDRPRGPRGRSAARSARRWGTRPDRGDVHRDAVPRHRGAAPRAHHQGAPR